MKCLEQIIRENAIRCGITFEQALEELAQARTGRAFDPPHQSKAAVGIESAAASDPVEMNSICGAVV